VDQVKYRLRSDHALVSRELKVKWRKRGVYPVIAY